MAAGTTQFPTVEAHGTMRPICRYDLPNNKKLGRLSSRVYPASGQGGFFFSLTLCYICYAKGHIMADKISLLELFAWQKVSLKCD